MLPGHAHNPRCGSPSPYGQSAPQARSRLPVAQGGGSRYRRTCLRSVSDAIAAEYRAWQLSRYPPAVFCRAIFISSFASPSGPIRLPPLVAINSPISSFRIVIRFSYVRSFWRTAFTQNYLYPLRYRAQLTAVNATNVVAPYNFLSTFSGTRFVSPRSFTAEIGLVW